MRPPPGEDHDAEVPRMGVTLREAPHGRMDGSGRACMEILSGN